MTRVPDYVAERIRRPIREGCSVVEGSTPVVSFGNPEVAWVATLGLNPSRREFTDDTGKWLQGGDRRLATLDGLGLPSLEGAGEVEVAEVVEYCYDYFARNPYWLWFQHLEALLNHATGASYRDGTACHLDLVQWATDPVWGKLDVPTRQRLIDEDREFLREQLQWEGIRLVLLNGAGVIEQVRKMGIVLEEREPLTAHGNTAKVVVGEEYGTTFIGWSKNLQSAFGMSTAFRHAIADRVRLEVAAADVATPPIEDHHHGHLERGRTVRSKSELVEVLAEWLEESSAPTIGDVGTFGRKAWVRVLLGEHQVVLNSDTKRAAVQAFVSHAEHYGAELPWSVVANANGKANKVVYTTEAELPGWYCYLTKPWTQPGVL